MNQLQQGYYIHIQAFSGSNQNVSSQKTDFYYCSKQGFIKYSAITPTSNSVIDLQQAGVEEGSYQNFSDDELCLSSSSSTTEVTALWD